jgi:hypothetical protein
MGLEDAPASAVGALFASLDQDGSGLLTYTELQQLISKSKQKVRRGARELCTAAACCEASLTLLRRLSPPRSTSTRT